MITYSAKETRQQKVHGLRRGGRWIQIEKQGVRNIGSLHKNEGKGPRKPLPVMIHLCEDSSKY